MRCWKRVFIYDDRVEVYRKNTYNVYFDEQAIRIKTAMTMMIVLREYDNLKRIFTFNVDYSKL